MSEKLVCVCVCVCVNDEITFEDCFSVLGANGPRVSRRVR